MTEREIGQLDSRKLRKMRKKFFSLTVIMEKVKTATSEEWGLFSYNYY